MRGITKVVIGVLVAAAVVVAVSLIVQAVLTSNSKTYTNASFHFSVTYDPNVVAASVNPASTRPDTTSVWPGIGYVHGNELELLTSLKEPTNVPFYERGEVQIIALKPARAFPQPTLAAFAAEPGMRSTRDWTISPPRPITLNGLPGFRYEMRGPLKTIVVVYTVFHGDFVYLLRLVAPISRWGSAAAKLNKVARTFKVTT